MATWASAFLLESALESANSPSQTGRATTPDRHELMQPLLTLLIFALVFGIGGQISFNSSRSFLLTNAVSVGGILVAGAIFFAFANVIGGKTRNEEIFPWVAPVVITAVVALPFVDSWYGIVLNAVIVVTYYLVNYNFLCFIARSCQMHGWNRTIATGATQAAVRAVMLAGIAGGSTFLANETIADFAKSAALALAVVYLLSMGLVRHLVSSQRGTFHEAPQSERPSTTAAIPAGSVTVPPGLVSLYALTDREADVLALLVGGYSVKLAAEELGVSPNTVRTHVRSLYNKMDIHNRDDLVRFCRLYAKIDEKRRD